MMQPAYQPPSQFTDFTPEYIQNLAQQNGFTYLAEDSGDSTESSLYNNPKTNAIELFKLQMEIAGLHCEYYTADYFPLVYADMPQNLVTATPGSGTQLTARTQVQVFSIDLPYSVENLYVESRTNVTINNILGLSSLAFKDSEQVRLEGDFSYFFKAVVPKHEEVTAFTILAPNIMLHLLADGGDYDFEFSGSKIYFYKLPNVIVGGTIPINQAAYNQMLAFGIKTAQTLARAARPAKLTDTTGVPQLWQLYGMSKAKLVTYIGMIVASFMFLTACVMNPLLWPLGAIVGFILYAKYRRLLKKRKRLVDNWQAEQS
jgi:hypothetical protein